MNSNLHLMVKNIKPIPWIPFLAFEYLQEMNLSELSIFEYGSGGSTLYFQERLAKVVSVEHDAEWYEKVKPALDTKLVEYHLIEWETKALGTDKSNPTHYTSGPYMANFRKYVTIVEDYPPFDLIFIDGRSRASCLAHTAGKVKPGGWIILDNVEREYYLTNTRHFFEGWETIEFFGHGPYITWPWRTLFLRRPLV